MPLFQQSSLTFDQAKTKVARAASAEGDTDMLTKAGDAIESAFQTWNNRRHWNFLKASHIFRLVAPQTIADCQILVNDTTIDNVVDSAYGNLVVGDVVSGTGILPGTLVTAVAPTGNTISVSTAPTTSATVTLEFSRRDYAAPTNFKYIYNMMDLTNNHPVFPSNTRYYDRFFSEPVPQGPPIFYDPHPLGADGKFRFLPSPSAEAIVLAKYYRRMTVPSVGATALDIPIDFEWGIIAEAKGLFLADKGGYDSQAAFWAAKANDAIAAAVLADNKHPDETASFTMGYGAAGVSRDSLAATDTDAGWGYGWGSDWGD